MTCASLEYVSVTRRTCSMDLYLIRICRWWIDDWSIYIMLRAQGSATKTSDCTKVIYFKQLFFHN